MPKLIKIFILFHLIVFTIGCNQIMPRNKEPKTIPENPMALEMPGNTKQSTPSIRDFKSVIQGVISDISSDGNQILLLNQNNSNGNTSLDENNTYLSVYNKENDTLHPPISSPYDTFMGKFDKEENGFYYLEHINDSSVELYWTNYSGDKKIKISSSTENMSPHFNITKDNDVYYGTKDGFIVITNKDKESITLNIGKTFNINDIRQVYYSVEKDYILFSATKEDSLNIYILNLKDNVVNLLISNTAGDFSVSPDQDTLLYITTRTDSNRRELGLLNLNNLKTNIISEGFIRQATFSPCGDRIAYLENVDLNTDLRNIWIYDIENQSTKQVSSNLRVIGNVFWNPQLENQLLFSTYQTQDNQFVSTVHSLDFE